MPRITRAKDARIIRAGISDAEAVVAKALTITRGHIKEPVYEGVYGRARSRKLYRELAKHNGERLTYSIGSAVFIRRIRNANSMPTGA